VKTICDTQVEKHWSGTCDSFCASATETKEYLWKKS